MAEKNTVELLTEEVTTLRAELESLRRQLAAPGQTATANPVFAREAHKAERNRKVAKEIAGSKPVRVRIQQFEQQLMGNGPGGKARVVNVDVSKPIAFSSKWRRVWADAPMQLQPFDEKGEVIVHTIPQRVYEALKDVLVLVQ